MEDLGFTNKLHISYTTPPKHTQVWRNLNEAFMEDLGFTNKLHISYTTPPKHTQVYT